MIKKFTFIEGDEGKKTMVWTSIISKYAPVRTRRRFSVMDVKMTSCAYWGLAYNQIIIFDLFSSKNFRNPQLSGILKS